MAYHNKEVYPRPDFVHAKQNWHPVNDGWTILYDDEDVGLTEGWQVSGVPDKVAISPAAVAAAEELECGAPHPREDVDFITFRGLELYFDTFNKL